MQTLYRDTGGLLQQLNPLSKVLAFFPVLAFVGLVTDPWAPLAFIALTTLVVLILGRVPIGYFLKIAGPLSLLVVGFFVFYPFVVRAELVEGSPVLFEVGPVTVYQDGMLYGLATALRLYALILLSLVFTLTTDITDFVRALIQQWRLPYNVGYGALAVFRFVPMLRSELGIIRAAHRVRGLSEGGGLRARYGQLKRYAVPLLATAIRRAERTALAMDGRAFGAFDERTYYRRLRFDRRDAVFVLGFWLASLAIVLVLWRAGLLGPLVLLQDV